MSTDRKNLKQMNDSLTPPATPPPGSYVQHLDRLADEQAALKSAYSRLRVAVMQTLSAAYLYRDTTPPNLQRRLDELDGVYSSLPSRPSTEQPDTAVVPTELLHELANEAELAMLRRVATFEATDPERIRLEHLVSSARDVLSGISPNTQ